ncbi:MULTISPECIES: hypothetical protein [Streptomyces]|uniref:Uncharacterized protein n=1 Tax=Streptomyces tsukubensis (strain DSM 42081 / NBRC 108919 / NRRL 18488 / 9993) TaxID=1114943 RepID=I2N859_STRT9|nr:MULTISPECIES: hypothetical protein [Streptomyces]AZK97110.1 hypothetical protein B7R87_27005 [Streptomyces tsukubensis]EIF93206.1 hypothetical protein [Streptomyces tsukubensis NRRL18488]MYS67956.1 hypothetical protein [Streptomyces sp. SID5473]QKM66919.1 hypothetical protein STSU_006765 [Streptomyces tsukubensis NRRL18488]TAI44733.1 hypothetical protein EWI31_05470 [Streptomyces tsukubensis]
MTCPQHQNQPFRELRGLLECSDRRYADPLRVGLVTAAEEMRNWLGHGRAYEQRHHRDAWRSVIADLRYAATLIGPRLQQVTAPLLQSTADSLPDLITEVGDLDPSVKAAAQQVCFVLLQRLQAPEVLTATWDDLVSACQGMEQDADLVMVRRDLLLDLFRLTDRDTRALARQLAGILGDQPGCIASAHAMTDGSGPEPRTVDRPTCLRHAGLSEQDRLSLCRELIAVQPKPARHVVWFAVSGLPYNPPGRIGEQIQFHTAGWLAVLREAKNRNGIGLPGELLDDGTGVRLDDLPGGRDTYLARVDLRDGCWNDVEAQARRLLEQVFSVLAHYGADAHPQVRNSEGFLHVRDGKLAGRRYNPSFPPDHNSTARAANNATRLMTHLARSGNTDGLPDDLDALRKMERSDDRVALALAQNILENRFRSLGINRRWEKGRENEVAYGWYSYAKEFLADRWANASLSANLGDAAYGAFLEALQSPEARKRLADIRSKLVTSRNGPAVLDRSGFMAALPAVLACAPPVPHTLRQLHTLHHRVATPASRSRWVREVQDRFDLGVDRFRRIRNAHQHGGPAATEGAMDSVRDLAAWLARAAIEVTADSAAWGDSSHTAHKHHRQQMREWRQDLVTATELDQMQWP